MRREVKVLYLLDNNRVRIKDVSFWVMGYIGIMQKRVAIHLEKKLPYIWGVALHGVGVALGLRETEGIEKASSSAMRTGIHLLTKLVCLFVCFWSYYVEFSQITMPLTIRWYSYKALNV